MYLQKGNKSFFYKWSNIDFHIEIFPLNALRDTLETGLFERHESPRERFSCSSVLFCFYFSEKGKVLKYRSERDKRLTIRRYIWNTKRSLYIPIFWSNFWEILKVRTLWFMLLNFFKNAKDHQLSIHSIDIANLF